MANRETEIDRLYTIYRHLGNTVSGAENGEQALRPEQRIELYHTLKNTVDWARIDLVKHLIMESPSTDWREILSGVEAFKMQGGRLK